MSSTSVWQLRQRQLPCHAVAAVHEIDAIADDDGLRGCGATDLRRRASGGPEQDEAGAGPVRRLRARERRRAQERRAGRQK